MGMTVPTQWGGAGADHVAYVARAGRRSPPAMARIADRRQRPQLGRRDADPELRHRGPEAAATCATWRPAAKLIGLLPRPSPRAGSDAAARYARARCSDGRRATCCLGPSSSSPAAPRPTSRWSSPSPTRASGRRGITAFLVDTKNARLRRQRASRRKWASNAVRHLRGPAPGRPRPRRETDWDEEGQGYRIALANLEGGRIGIGAQMPAACARRGSGDRRALRP